MLYMVYRVWYQINMHELCKWFVFIKYTVMVMILFSCFSVPTPPSPFCYSVQSELLEINDVNKSAKGIIYMKVSRQKLRWKKMGTFGNPKNCVCLLGLAGIPETPLLFGLRRPHK